MNRVYHLPSHKNLNPNPSIELFENIMKLPLLTNRRNNHKKIDLKLEDKDFMIHYIENKKRIKVQYTSKNLPSEPFRCAGKDI